MTTFSNLIVWDQKTFRLQARHQSVYAQMSMYPACKRAMDIAVSGTVLLMISPVLLLVSTLIWLTDRGPILYWQTRVGEGGAEFQFPKFRSMVVNADVLKEKLAQKNQHSDQRTFKMKHDPRVTWLGRWIRRLSIDEMPQLWLVFTGKMTLVGPRPSLPKEVALYDTEDRRRLNAKPGLTCFWQVSGRAEIPFKRQVEMDAAYIEHRSFWLDLKLLFLTVPAVLGGDGAY